MVQAAGEDLFDHGGVSPTLGVPDAEVAVFVQIRLSRGKNDHRGGSVGTLGVADIVGLEAGEGVGGRNKTSVVENFSQGCQAGGAAVGFDDGQRQVQTMVELWGVEFFEGENLVAGGLGLFIQFLV